MADRTATDVAWLALGSNVGNRGHNLQRLQDEIDCRGAHVEAASSEILTRAVGLRRQPDYHNQVLRVRSRTPMTPHEWLRLCKDSETAAGRKQTYRWGPRIADADILLLGERGEIIVNEPDLTVPHAELRNRPFLARLLSEIGLPI